MERPSFTAVLKHAHHFTVKNLGTFFPLALKTLLLCIILIAGFGTSLFIWAFLSGFIDSNMIVTSVDQVISIATPASVICGIVLVAGLVIGLVLAINPFDVSIYRRALLDEEVDRRYLKRIFAKRELNFLIAQLKILGVLLIFLALVCIVGGILFTLAVYVQSMLLNIIAAIIGGIVVLGLFLFLCARLVFVMPSVVLDRGSNLKTSIAQSRGFTVLLISIWVLVTFLSRGLDKVLDKTSSLMIERFADNLTVELTSAIVNWALILFISYFTTIFVAAALSYIYKFAVLKESAGQKLKG